MAIKIELYGENRFIDITDKLTAVGGKFPETFKEGIYPDDIASENDVLWYDLLRAINLDETLRKTFFNGKVHPMRITDTDGHTFDARVLIETRYSSRNA